MNITDEKIGDLGLQLHINVEASDYLPVIDSTIKDYRKKVDLKGFRKGQVPKGMIKKMYGQQILAEEMGKLLNKSISEYIRENNVMTLGEPLPVEKEVREDLDIYSDKSYDFTFELGIQPEVDLKPLHDNANISRFDIATSDELVNEEIERLQQRYGTVEVINEVKSEEDVCVFTLNEVDADGNVVEGGLTNEPAVAVNTIIDAEVKEKMMAMKMDDTLVVDIFTLLNQSREDIAKHFLNLEGDEAAAVDCKFQLTLQKVNHRGLAEVNEELFTKLYGEDITTEDAFRNKLKEELKSMLDYQAELKLNNDIVKMMLDEIEMPLPDEFLKRWLAADNEVTVEQIASDYEPFSRNLRWTLVVNKVMEESELKVEREDITETTKEMLKLRYGFNDSTEEGAASLEQMVNHLMADQEHVQQTFNEARDKKVFAAIKEKLTVQDEPISYDTFKEMTEKEREAAEAMA